MPISREIFEQQRRRRFGTANPERMQIELWEWMIRGGDPPYVENCDEEGPFVATGLTPYQVFKFLDVPFHCNAGPTWTLHRMGATQTQLDDGRVVCIGGEYEDFYDPEFCIYNDIVIFRPDSGIEIYGYPQDIFPPTDFHAAVLAEARIIIVGGLGYPDDRRPGHTPVYELDLASYKITSVPTSGAMPGWVFRHAAEYDWRRGAITLRGGELIVMRDGVQRIRRNIEDYELDLRSGIWRRLTDRNWRQYFVRREDGGMFMYFTGSQREALRPRTVDCDFELGEDYDRFRLVVNGVPVNVSIGVSAIEIIIEGELSCELINRLAEEIRASAEAIVKGRCILEHD